MDTATLRAMAAERREKTKSKNRQSDALDWAADEIDRLNAEIIRLKRTAGEPVE